MLELEEFRMQGQSRRVGFVCDQRAVQRTAINGVTADSIALLRQMNAYLMRPPRLQLTFHKRAVSDRLDRADVSGRRLTGIGNRCAASESIAAITNKLITDCDRRW